MRSLIFTTLFIGSLFGWDSAPRQAKEKFANSEFSAAAALFEAAFDQYPRQKASLEFNIAQCWAKLDSMPRAINWYARAAENKLNAEVSSLSWNNLGALWASQQSPAAPQAAPDDQGASAQGSDPLQAELDKVNRSLEAFKNALRKLPDNDFARYNYELLKRKQQQLQQQQQNQQQNKNEEQEQEQKQEEKDDSQQNKPQDQQKSKKNTENKGNQQQGEEGEEKISMDEARQLLQAMKDNEKRFLQQLEKSKKHRKSNQDGPDW